MTETTQPEAQAETATLGAVIERLDRLEGVLRELLAAVREGAAISAPAKSVVASAVASVIPVAPPAGPSLIPVAPPVRDAWAPPPAVNSVLGGPTREFESGLPVEATIHQVLTRLFEAAIMSNQEEAFGIMAALTHHTQMQGPRAFEHFKGFTWSKLRRNARSYLQTEEPNSFAISYTEPRQVPQDAREVRVFIHAQQRMPVPVSFERDPTQGYAWRITMMSL